MMMIDPTMVTMMMMDLMMAAMMIVNMLELRIFLWMVSMSKLVLRMVRWWVMLLIVMIV